MLKTNNNITLKEAKTIRLSKNFTLDEFIKSNVATRNSIDNSMPKKYLDNIQNLVTYVLQPLRDKFGPIRILSGYRSVELSLKIGSSTKSNHNFGLAADIEAYDKNVSLLDLLTHIEQNLKYKELIAEFFPDGWVHVAYQHNFNKQQLKLKDKAHDYTHMTLREIKYIYKV